MAVTPADQTIGLDNEDPKVGDAVQGRTSPKYVNLPPIPGANPNN